jgi:tripeptide aminopeptidase
MINRDRMVKEFVELVQINSLTRKEREMADALKSRLQHMGQEPCEDDTGNKIGGNAGNVIFTVKGDRNVPAILLMAHMDTVVPGTGKKPIIQDDIIKTDGTTVLGGDDIAGVECILEAVRVLKEDGISHGDIEVAFTVAEEGGLYGAKHLDYGRLNARYCFVLVGGGEIGSIAVKAPSQNKIDIIIKGKAAHAGIEPEKGINAIQVASEAISGMKLGRIDFETTANIGVIKGGEETNIICDRVEMHAEVRSRSEEKLEKQTTHMRECFERAANKFGASVLFKSDIMYRSFNVDENSDIISIVKKAAVESGIKLVLEATGGGSDTNIVNTKGIQAVDMSIGMDKVHSVEEQININDMAKAAEFLLSIIKNVR